MAKKEMKTLNGYEVVDAKARETLDSLSEAIVGFKQDVFDITKSPNCFNGNWNTGYMNTEGRVDSTSVDYKHTDMIRVVNSQFIITGDSLLIGRRCNVEVRFVTAFDENKQLLSDCGLQRIGNDDTVDGDTSNVFVIELDSRVKYIVLSIYRPIIKYENISVSFDTVEWKYEPYGKITYKLREETLPDNIKQTCLTKYLTGKTVAIFGDSIMYGAGNGGNGVADLLGAKYGMTVNKYCVSGSTMGVRTDNSEYTVDEVHHIGKQVRNAIADGIVPDLIILNGGTNDITGNIPLGELSTVYTEPESENYFADGFETVAYLLTKNFVGVPVIYMRAHNMASRTYDGQVSYGELGNKIAEKWGIRNIDMYIRMNTQLVEYQTLYLADYTHPNKSGYEKYYIPALENFIFSELIHE